jgi:hypothetical protein
MYLDYQLRLSSSQSVGSAAAGHTSTYFIDAIQSGWGHDEELYARFMVQTAFAGSAGSSITLAIQIAQDTAFATVITVISVVKAATSLTAKMIPLVAKLPVAMMTGQTGGDTLYNSTGLPYRYIRGLYTTTFALSAGALTVDLVKSSVTTIDRPL